MPSTITDTLINEAILDNGQKRMLTKVNDGVATLTDVAACQLSLSEKAILRDLVNGVATRVGINARHVSLPFKSVALAIANV